MLSPALRKAAVLISTLDDETAEAVLRQMSADDAAKVRSALVALEGISDGEQQQVLTEFLRQQGAPALTPIGDEGVALELDPLVEAAASNQLPANDPAPLPPPRHDERPFAFLEAVDPKAIADLLAREHPQTAAVVVAHLPPPQAAAVLELLPAALATDALERIAWLSELTPEVQADLSRELKRQLAPHLAATSAAPQSLAHLAAVIGAMDFRQRNRVVLQLGDRNQALLNRLGLYPSAENRATNGDAATALRYRLDSTAAAANRDSWSPPEVKPEEHWLAFDDLALLDDAALRAVFAAADIEIALLALTGAEPRLLSRILQKLPAGQAGALRRRLEHPGPVRLRDIEQARASLAAVASRLAHEGTIALPPTARFAAAV